MGDLALEPPPPRLLMSCAAPLVLLRQVAWVGVSDRDCMNSSLRFILRSKVDAKRSADAPSISSDSPPSLTGELSFVISILPDSTMKNAPPYCPSLQRVCPSGTDSCSATPHSWLKNGSFNGIKDRKFAFPLMASARNLFSAGVLTVLPEPPFSFSKCPGSKARRFGNLMCAFRFASKSETDMEYVSKLSSATMVTLGMSPSCPYSKEGELNPAATVPTELAV
mmetsp:Transcript_36589/g.84127  ORF Transcript_36589/g.84127 Transcript_36589/m.84127 type:complete len:223 (+) Transcript_36589:386-1054(+)